MTYSSNSNAVKISRSDAIAGLSVLRSVITGIVLFMLGLFLFFSTQHAEAKVKKPGGPGMFIPVSKVGGRALGASTSFSKTGKQTSCDTVEYRIRYTFDVDDPAYLDDPILIDAVDKTDVEIEDVLPAGLSATNVTISGDITDGVGGLPVAAISSGANPNDTIRFTGVKFSLVDLDGDGSLTSRSFEIVITAKIDPAAFPAPSMVDNQAFMIAKLGGITSTTASHDPAVPDDGDPKTGDPTSVLIDLTDCDTPPGDGGGTPESEPCFKVEKGEVECAKDGGGAFIYNMPVGPEMAGRSIELVSLTPGVIIAPVSQIVPAGGGVLSWTIIGAAPGTTVSLSVVGMEIGAGPAEGWGLCCTQRIDIEIPEGIECPPEEEGEPDIKVEKKADVDICNTAGGCDFTITVSNIGDAPYTGKIVLDEVTSPGNATLAGAPNAPWNCVPNISPMVCSHPSTTLNPGESVELNLSFIPGGGWNWRDIKNCAEYNYDASEQPVPFGRLDNDKACASIPIGLQAPIPDPDPEKKVDLELKKEHGGMTCDPEGICYFFIYIKNVGTENFNGPLSVVDNYMSGAPLASEFAPSPPWECSQINPTQFRCDSLGNINLPAGAFTRIRIMTTIDPAKMAGGIVENCATLDAVPGETNLDNQKDCAKIPVTPPKDGEPKIEIEKVCSVLDPGSTSDRWTCKITVTNNGTAASEKEISILEELSLLEGVTIPEMQVDVPGDIPCARQGAAEFDCSLAGSDLPPGTTKELNVSFSLEAGHKFENCATVYERDQGPEGGQLGKACFVGEKEKLEEETQCTPPLIETHEGRCGCPIGTKYRNGKCVDIKGPFSGTLCTRLPGQIRTKDNECRCRRGTVLNQAGTKCVKPEPQLCKLKPGQIRTANGQCVCPKGERFSNRSNRCVPVQCKLKPGQIRTANGQCVCPKGERFSNRSNRCVPVQCKLKPGQIRTANGQCVCPKGERFSNRRNRCVPVQCKLKPGQIRTANGQCVCPKGERFSNRRNRCVPVQCKLKPGQIRTANGQCVCPNGERFSNRRNKCVPPPTRTCQPNTGLVLRNGKCVCDRGLVWDPKGQECEPPSINCSRSEQYDTRLKKCVPIVTPCPKGQKYDQRRRRCVPIVTPCPKGQKYDQRRRRCVPIVTPCPKGQKYDQRRRRCVPIVTPCPKGQKYDQRRRRCVPIVTPCPKGQKYDQRRRRCVPIVTPCPKGQKYDQRRRRCVPIVTPCPKGQKYDQRRRRCVPIVTPCPKGQKYDQRRRRCVPIVTPCPKGQKYDRRRRRCVPIVTPCPKGLKYDRRRRRCVPILISCPNGQRYDRRRKRCVAIQPGCPKGQRYDRRRKRCVAIQPGCPKGQRYDRRRKRCVAIQPGCPKGQRYDRRRKRCVAIQPGCPKGQRYDRRRKRCVATQPGCPKGQRYDRRRRRCVATQPICRKGQVRKGNRCVTIQKGPGRPRCRKGEVLFRGKCQQKLI